VCVSVCVYVSVCVSVCVCVGVDRNFSGTKFRRETDLLMIQLVNPGRRSLVVCYFRREKLLSTGDGPLETYGKNL